MIDGAFPVWIDQTDEACGGEVQNAFGRCVAERGGATAEISHPSPWERVLKLKPFRRRYSPAIVAPLSQITSLDGK
jgi:hypothetical protein